MTDFVSHLLGNFPPGLVFPDQRICRFSVLVVVKGEGHLCDQLLNNCFQITVFAHTAMGPKPYISKDKISRIYTVHKAGLGAKAVVEQTDVAQRIVERWLARGHASTSDTPPKLLPKSGWP